MEFLGRSRELETLKTEFAKPGKSAILVYGRRRIGKTTLIDKALEGIDRTIIRFTAKPDELSENARRLSEAWAEAMGIDGFMIPDFEKLMAYISRQQTPFILVIDEYQDLRMHVSKPLIVDAILRDFIDKAGDNIKLIICGSAIRTMKALMDIENPLYKRFSLEMSIGELDYLEASLFYKERTIREKISLYAIFGGIPMILSSIEKDSSVESNVMKLIMDRNGIARSYIEDILRDETASQSAAYSAIVRIGNGRRSFSDIESQLDSKNARDALPKALKDLVKADFIEKKQPINEQGNRKKTFYEIKINILRFYLTYIERFSADTSSVAFFRKYVEPSLVTFISYRFEAIARSYFSVLSEKGYRDDIVCVGTYWYDDPKTKTNGEFNVALETLDGYEIYEVKYLSSPMTEALIEEEQRKVQSLGGMDVRRIGFISSSGFEKNGKNRLSGNDLYALSF